MTNDKTENGRPDEEEQIGSNADNAAYLTRALARFDPLDKQEAQAFVYRELLSVSRQRTAEETDMSPDDVELNLISAQTKVERARHTIEIIEEYAP
jgi:DNA-directed RNA polymerase specialized sigma24 family protein